MGNLVRSFGLSPQARLIFQHLERAGDISAREAMADYGITSATLARRICDIEGVGIKVTRIQRKHPITGRKYTRYALSEVKAA